MSSASGAAKTGVQVLHDWDKRSAVDSRFHNTPGRQESDRTKLQQYSRGTQRDALQPVGKMSSSQPYPRYHTGPLNHFPIGVNQDGHVPPSHLVEPLHVACSYNPRHDSPDRKPVIPGDWLPVHLERQENVALRVHCHVGRDGRAIARGKVAVEPCSIRLESVEVSSGWDGEKRGR